MKASDSGRQLIKSLEGLELEAYPDGTNPDGSSRYSIGYGHNGVPKGSTITRAQAESIFLSDLSRFETAVNNLVREPRTTQQQFDALVSFAWNVGEGAKGLAGSTLLRLHNEGDFSGAAAEFPRWIHSGGVVDPRLVSRRAVERELYQQGIPVPDTLRPPAEPEPLDTRPPVAAAGIGVLFFCPSCGGSCVAKLIVEKGV